MLRSAENLESIARLVLQISRARSISIFLPAGTTQPRPILTHAGEADPLPELVDIAAGEALEADSKAAHAEPDSALCVASADTAGLLVRWTVSDTHRRGPETVAALWFGVRRDPDTESPNELDETERTLFRVAAELVARNQEIVSFLADPLTVLPARAAFQTMLRRLVDSTGRDPERLSLVLINAHDVAAINQRHGWEVGDQVIREIGDRLIEITEPESLLYRYGGAVFALILPQTSIGSAAGRAEELLSVLGRQRFLRDELRLTFSAGVASLGGDGHGSGDRALRLVRQADRALSRAKSAGGARVEVSEGRPDGAATAQDRLSGIFTADAAKDYRNMLLLWDTVAIVAESEDSRELANRIADRLSSVFRPRQVAFFGFGKHGRLELLADQALSGRSSAEPGSEPDESFAGVIEDAEASGGVARIPTELGSSIAVPLTARGNALGFLCLETDLRSAAVGTAEEILLDGLGRQIAAALDRARLAQAERQRREHERKQLRSELSDLRQALMRSKLLFRSPQMEVLLTNVRRVAPTDATVLITGESGTGKELLARTVHQLSERREVEPVVVDCSAIAATLIDSELFGRERGAFTGAERRSPGRLAESDGGTVILDEIGELPLEVQSKLLRFVQEKQLTPVGGTQTVTVDARVIAVTNRDLAAEVAAGRFREDLFYRLNVVRLRMPALRERPEDILFLAEAFRERFAVQYQKTIGGFDLNAEELILAHEWPGNVRELQNRVMQAVLLCAGDRIAPSDLGLPASTTLRIAPARHGPSPPAEPTAAERPGPTPPAPAPPPPAGTAAASPRVNGGPTSEEAWSSLRSALARQVEVAAGDEAKRHLPLGRWLSEDLVLIANRESEGVLSRGANRLGIPETTFRRRLHKAAAQERAGLLRRSSSWTTVATCLEGLVRAEHPEGTDVPRRVRDLLLAEVVGRVPASDSAGAALMGVTQPTFQRWSSRLPRP